MLRKKNVSLVITLIAFLFCSLLNGHAQTAHTGSPLKILFVGYDATRLPHEIKKDLYMDPFSEKDSVRMPAFKVLLSEYFAEVKTIDCRDWKTTDSDPYDVTIFDYPTSITENVPGPGLLQHRRLPDNFSKPVVFIASAGPEMGLSIGLNFDWLCLCLGADAHHINTRHPIFNGPLEKVHPTLEMKETPVGIYNYPSGDTVPHHIPMWKVNKVSYQTTPGARVGLVSHGTRFTESPDVEVISSGDCLKDVRAVALSRHGNFFLWGFAASPAMMTEEAKKVFVNTVAYMKQFDGQTPIARRSADMGWTTELILENAARASRKYWERTNESNNLLNKWADSLSKALKAKMDAGKPLTDAEKGQYNAYGNMEPLKPVSWEDYLKPIMGPFAEKFGTDAAAFQQYLKDNIGYIYRDPKKPYEWYNIDEDARQLKISNHDTKLLETCIKMLKQNKDTALAMRVLKRYTPENFATAAEWDKWYKSNKNKLFFTELSDYKFLVNTLKN